MEAEALPGCIGIAHTRWATHGSPSEVNSHPHMANGVAVVHNGIVENHGELRQRLKRQGCNFLSETDSEVIPWLISRAVEGGAGPARAVHSLGDELDGSFAVAVLTEARPQRLARQAPWQPARRRARTARRAICRQTFRRWRVSPPRRSSSATAIRSSCAATPSPCSTRAADRCRVRSLPVDASGRLIRQGRLSALHAQGDPRPAGRRATPSQAATTRAISSAIRSPSISTRSTAFA